MVSEDNELCTRSSCIWNITKIATSNTITSPDVPGLVTEGSTPEEISHNVQEALEGLLEVWAELKLPIPPALERARSQMPKTADLLVAA